MMNLSKKSKTLKEKVEILSSAARYDVSCASSGSSRPNGNAKLGNTSSGGICHSWTSDGRCVSLLKILLSNDCLYDCAYCANRRSNDIPRSTFSVNELVNITVGFYRRNYIEGLFLSSGIYSTPNQTLLDMVEVAEILRAKHDFGGYIHLKICPGASPDLITRAGRIADRLSVNIELPSEKSLRSLAPQKNRNGILKPMAFIGENYQVYVDEKRRRKKPPAFTPAGQSTQMIVGASPESDARILTLSESLYKSYKLKRVYYSAYIPINSDERLPCSSAPPLRREHRLYQADWLLRFYGFQVGELFSSALQNLDPGLDPKCFWALNHFDLYPIDINKANYETLLRIPGIGVKSAKKIIRIRSVSAIREEDLSKIGLVMKRAKYFISVRGKYFAKPGLDRIQLATILSDSTPEVKSAGNDFYQPNLF